MSRASALCSSLSFVLAAGLAASPAAAQPGRRPAEAPLPSGQRIDVHDGDTIVVENGARIRIVRRHDANVLAIYNAAEHWIVLLLDDATADGSGPDGRVDFSHTYHGVAEGWPFGERWEGTATIEEYSAVPAKPGGLGLIAAGTLVQFLNPSDNGWFRSPSAVVLASPRSGGTALFGASFVEAERRAVADAHANAVRTGMVQSGGGFTSSLNMSAGGAVSGAVASGGTPMTDAPVRVGGNIRSPRKIADAAPVYPAEAEQAGIRGVVILEVIIGADGSVKDAKVLRSIPLLDAAALAAVRQWRYEPTLLNGNPVRVVMTVTVPFVR